MCLAFVCRNVSAAYPLILLFNRDEDYDRATLPACWWENPRFVAGKDQLKGGTWAGVSKDGDFGMLTFVRGPREKIKPAYGRGEIVPRWMNERGNYENFCNFLVDTKGRYLGYNLVFGNRENLFHFNNHEGRFEVLSDGIHGVSNASLNSPWFKVKRGKQALTEVLLNHQESSEISTETLVGAFFAILRDKTLAPDDEVQVTGLNPQREKLKSALFVDLPDYGTICSTVVLYGRNGDISYFERSFARGGLQIDSRDFCFTTQSF